MSRAALVLVLALATPALAARPALADADDHVGIEFDFLVGARRYDQARFSLIDGNTSPSLVAAFEGSPFDGIAVAGAGMDAHIAINHVRFAFGFAWPYVQFDGPIVSRDAETAQATTVQVRRMEAKEVQLAVGYEHGLGPVSLFADLVGTADSVETDLAVGDTQGTYRTRGFGFSTRAGGRYRFHEMFYLHAAGELGLTGHRSWGLVAGVGMGTP
jgi:hypothetical protein